MTSLAQLQTESRQRADMENSEFVTDSELTTYINRSYRKLYDLLVSKFNDYFIVSPENPPQFTLAAGEATFDLPENFYKLVGVDRSTGGNDWYVLRPFNFEDRNSRRNVYLYRGLYPTVRYRIIGNILRFMPEDQAVGTYRYWYVPKFTPLVESTDELDINCDIWSEYIVVDAAIKMLQKEESDVSVLKVEQAELVRQIEEMAANRDVGEPERVTDITRSGYDDPLFYRG